MIQCTYPLRQYLGTGFIENGLTQLREIVFSYRFPVLGESQQTIKLALSSCSI